MHMSQCCKLATDGKLDTNSINVQLERSMCIGVDIN